MKCNEASTKIVWKKYTPFLESVLIVQLDWPSVSSRQLSCFCLFVSLLPITPKYFFYHVVTFFTMCPPLHTYIAYCK